MALVSWLALPLAHFVALIGLLVLLIRAERRADRWEGHARSLAKRIIADRAHSDPTVVAPQWHAPRRGPG